MMKGVSIAKTGGLEVLEYLDIPVPRLEKPGMILVRNEFIGVNFIDTYHRTGLYALPSYPATLGREGAGVVVESTSAEFRVGDRVAYFSPGSYADFTAVSDEKASHIPKSLDSRVAAASLLQGLTALAFTTHSFTIKPGHIALIHAAAGGTGSLLVQLVKTFGGTVIGTTTSKSKIDVARELGCDHVILNDGGGDGDADGTGGLVKKVMELTGGKGVSVVYDGVGKATFDLSLACLGRHGTLVTFGNASGKVDPFDVLRLTKGSVRLMRPTLVDYLSTRDEFQSLSNQLWSLLEDGKIGVKVYKVYPLNEVAKAHADLESKKSVGKVLLQPQTLE